MRKAGIEFTLCFMPSCFPAFLLSLSKFAYCFRPVIYQQFPEVQLKPTQLR